MDFAFVREYKVKRKLRESVNKLSDLARKLQKLLNMLVTVLPNVIGAHRAVYKSLEKRLVGLEIKGRIQTVQIAAF